MPGIFPIVNLEVAPIPAVDGVQESPLFVWQDCAARWADDSDTEIDGRYIPEREVAEGRGVWIPQHTVLAGADVGADAARRFDVLRGTVKDDWVHPDLQGMRSLLMQDGRKDARFEVQETEPYTTDGLTHSLLIVSRGAAAPDADRSPEDVNLYVELADGADEGNYRLCLEWGQPIRLEWAGGGSADWKAVAIASALGDLQTYLANNGGEVRIAIRPDVYGNVLWVEIGNGVWLRHCPSTEDGNPGSLPTQERLRVYGRNGWWAFSALPLVFQDLTVSHSRLRYGRRMPNVQEAELVVNGIAVANPDQRLTTTSLQDEAGALSWQITATTPRDPVFADYSTDPATLSDVAMVIPSVWVRDGDSLPWPATRPPLKQWEELEVYDEASQTISAEARLTFDNRWSPFTGAFGNYAFDLAAGLVYVDGDGRVLGSTGVAPRMRGMLAGGVSVIRHDPVRLAQVTGHDYGYRLQRPLGQELILDGWSLYGAVHAVLDIGQIPPELRRRIPYWLPGPAGYECPHQILPRGSGSGPAMRFPPNATCMSVLLELVKAAAPPEEYGRAVPFVTGQGLGGQWYFEPWDLAAKAPVAGYSDRDPSGAGQILEIEVRNSIENLRTDIDFQGLDPRTGELLWAHMPLPWNVPVIGYRYPWLERNPAWVDEGFMRALMDRAAYLASLPTQTVHMRAPYNPWVHAGDLIAVSERQALGRAGVFVVTQIRSQCGLADIGGRTGEMTAESWITAREAVGV